MPTLHARSPILPREKSNDLKHIKLQMEAKLIEIQSLQSRISGEIVKICDQERWLHRLSGKYDSESNELRLRISDEIAKLTKKISPTVEEIELKNSEYRSLQRKLI
jgi:hypothetical protein